MSYVDDGFTDNNTANNYDSDKGIKSSHPYSVGFSRMQGTIQSNSYDESLISHLKEKEITKQKLRRLHFEKRMENVKHK